MHDEHRFEDTREEILDDLQFSLKEIGRAADIVRSLLDVSRQTQVHMEPVNINAAVEDALRILYNQYKNMAITVEKNFENELPSVEGNFANLAQVFINVIKNAIQAIGQGKGTVELRTGYRRDTDAVFIECRDTGCGIPEKHVKDIFKPFFTTKEVG